MKKLIFVFCLLGFICNKVSADTLDVKMFAFLQGNWKGVLTYTDYQDDKSQVNLPTWVSFSEKNGIIAGNYTYQEPNGTPVYQQSQIKLNSAKTKVRFDDDLYEVVEVGNNMLLLALAGEDNNQKALIHKKYEWKEKQLTITKMVKYEGTKDFFVRNRYQFSHETDTEIEARLLKDLLGKWTIDLRPSPTDAAYLKDFTLSNYTEKSLSGIFYDTAFEGGKIHTSWGKIYFSFITKDNSGTYFHSGYIENGELHGTTFSAGRDFLMPWTGVKQR